MSDDDFVRELQEERATAIWVADLSDGSKAFMDDGRPGTSGAAWLRLRERCAATGLRVTGLELRFRSNRIRSLPNNAEGYFFCRSSIGYLYSGHQENYYLTGVLRDGKVMVQRWWVPELVYASTETREAKDCEFGLITGV